MLAPTEREQERQYADVPNAPEWHASMKNVRVIETGDPLYGGNVPYAIEGLWVTDRLAQEYRSFCSTVEGVALPLVRVECGGQQRLGAGRYHLRHVVRSHRAGARYFRGERPHVEPGGRRDHRRDVLQQLTSGRVEVVVVVVVAQQDRVDVAAAHVVFAHERGGGAGQQQLAIRELNTSIYVFDADALWPALERLEPHNAQGELYLTDLVAAAAAQGRPAGGVACADSWQVQGVNDRVQLAEVRASRQRLVEAADVLAVGRRCLGEAAVGARLLVELAGGGVGRAARCDADVHGRALRVRVHAAAPAPAAVLLGAPGTLISQPVFHDDTEYQPLRAGTQATLKIATFAPISAFMDRRRRPRSSRSRSTDTT